jgi:predicted  nucleic acid-binding Zn-ribbon protein
VPWGIDGARSPYMAEDIELKTLLEQARQFNSKLDSFREHFEARFDQQIELIKSSFRSLSQEIASLRESVDVRFKSVDVRFEQQLELIRSGFKTLSQEIATLKKI